MKGRIGWWVGGIAVLAMSIAGAPARAGGDFCVATQQQFAEAAIAAQFEPLTIKLVQGTYEIAGTLFDAYTASFPGFTLLGGYTANCAGRDIASGNTVLHSAASTAGFFVNMIGDLTIEGVTFTGPAGGVFVTWDNYSNDIPDAELNLRRNTFTGSHTSPIYISWLVDDDSVSLTARVVNNLVHDNPGSGSGGLCAVELGVIEGNDATLDLINNTIVDNSVGDGGVCVGRYGDNEGSLYAYNNIMYGNAGYDFASNMTAFVLIDNVIGTHNGYPTPIVPPSGTLTGNPELNGSFRPIESPPSPVINSGSNIVPGGLPAHDLDGGARTIGTTVDRGAYESSIDNAFIQTVTSASDAGAGSLRAAIASVNANGGGLIKFNLGAGCGPHVITLASNLPEITAPVFVNGYTQAGSTQNDLDVGDDASICVIIEAGGGAVTRGLGVGTGADDAVSLVVAGLAFSGFSAAAIDFEAGSQHGVQGSHFGGNVNGQALQPNGTDIQLGVLAHHALIGGDDVADRNIIGDATGNGIVLLGGASGPLVVGTHDDQIVNNYVGVGWNPNTNVYTNRANTLNGIHVLGHDNVISGNLIGDNLRDGIDLNGEGALNNIMEENLIGADANGTNLGNASMGVRAENDAHDNTIRSNTIADNGQKGVRIVTGRGNKIRKNSIYGNAALGIDLAAEGVTPNDDDGAIQPSDYANRGQNFPVLTGAAGGSQIGSVAGSLTTTQGDYTIDIYANAGCDASGYGEGLRWLRGATVTVPPPQAGDQGTVDFAIAIRSDPPGFFFTGEAITVTATDAVGDTSEFSACTSYFDDTIFANGFDPAPQ